MQVIPAVDVLDGKVVRLMEGDYDRVTVYAEDPVEQAVTWQAAGAALVHVVDLAGARDGTASDALWGALAASGIRFQVGGGIRTPADAANAVVRGASRVVMGTAAVWQPRLLADTVARLGADRVVAALDVRAGRATGQGWLDEGRPLDVVVTDLVAAGVERMLVTGIGRDGTMRGPDLDVISRVAGIAPDVAILGSGGVGDLADLAKLAASGVEGAIVGRALYEGVFTIEEALVAANEPPPSPSA
jgi:phosphoribosylformimino-5-aminoimidazole carboxamide ribotide isomerase